MKLNNLICLTFRKQSLWLHAVSSSLLLISELVIKFAFIELLLCKHNFKVKLMCEIHILKNILMGFIKLSRVNNKDFIYFEKRE